MWDKPTKHQKKKIFLIENFKNTPRVSYSMKLIFLTLIFLKEEGILQLRHFKFSFFLIPKKWWHCWCVPKLWNYTVLLPSILHLPSLPPSCLQLWFLMDSIAWWSGSQALEQVISVWCPAQPLTSCWSWAIYLTF